MHSELTKFPALLSAAGPALAIGMNIYFDHGPLAWFSLQSSQAKMGYESNSSDRCVVNHTVGQSTLTEDTDAVNSSLSTDDASGHPTEDIDEDEPMLQTSRAFVYVPAIFYGLGLLPFRSQRHLPAAASVQVSAGLSESVAHFDGDEISLPSATSVQTAASLSQDHLAWVSDICAEHLSLHNCLDLSLHVGLCSVQSFLGSDHWIIFYLQSEDAVLEQSYHVWVDIPAPTLDLEDLYLDALCLSEGPSVSATATPSQPSDKEVSTRRSSPVASVLMPASLSEAAITVTCIVLCAFVCLLRCTGRCYQRFGGRRVDQEAHPNGSLFTITPNLNSTSLPTDDEDTVWDEHSDKVSVVLTCTSTEGEEQVGCEDDQSWADTDASLAVVVVREDCSFDSDHTLVAEDSLSGVLDSELKVDTELNLTYDSDLPYSSASPLVQQSAIDVLDPSAVRKLNKNATVFVPKAHRTRLEGPTVDNGQRYSGKENRVVLPTASLSARARTAMFIAAARATCSPRKNPFRGIRRKGLKDFDVEEHFCLPVGSSVGFRLSPIEPLVPVWDLNYSFLSPYVPIQSSRSMDTFRIPQHEQHAIPCAQSVHNLSTLQMDTPGSAVFEEAPRSSLSMDIPDSAAFEEQPSPSSSNSTWSLNLLQSFRTMDDLMFIQDLPVGLPCTKSMGDLSRF